MSDENDELGDFEGYDGDDEGEEEQPERKAKQAVGETQVVEEVEDDEDVEEAGEDHLLNHLGGDPEDVPDDLDPSDLEGEEMSLQSAETVARMSKRLDDLEQERDALRKVGANNPVDVDPRVGDKDLCFDRAKPGAKVQVVGVLAESVEEYEEEFPESPELDSFEGNVLVRYQRADPVFACVYVKDSLTSTPSTAYPMPESRLTRVPVEEASLVGGEEAEFLRTRVPDGPNPEKVHLLSALLKSMWGDNPQAPINDLDLSRFRDLLSELVGEQMATAAYRAADYDDADN